MITLITGLPGHGKSLYALFFVKAYAEKEGRDVYYSGIKGLTLPWTEFEPQTWPSLPAGSIILMDEAQFNFPKKPNGSKLPDYYEQLAVHRHSGFDIFLITQHPSLLDNFVRKLCDRHLHIIRKFGMERAKIWEWQSANMSPEKESSHKSAILHKFSYPKVVYSYYKSAEVHTVKRTIPMRLVLMCLFIVSVICVGYYALYRYKQRGKELAEREGITQSERSNSARAAGGGAVAHASYRDAAADARQFVFDRTPRVLGLAYTAPRYDELTKPTRVPVPAACVHMGTRCSCYTQQATRLDVAFAQCVQIAHHGYFEDFDPNGEQARQQQSVQALNRDGPLPLSRVSTRDVPPEHQAAASSDDLRDGYGVLGHHGQGVRLRPVDSSVIARY